MIKLGGVAAAAGILSRLKVTTANEVATDHKNRDEGLAPDSAARSSADVEISVSRRASAAGSVAGK